MDVNKLIDVILSTGLIIFVVIFVGISIYTAAMRQEIKRIRQIMEKSTKELKLIAEVLQIRYDNEYRMKNCCCISDDEAKAGISKMKNADVVE